MRHTHTHTHAHSHNATRTHLLSGHNWDHFHNHCPGFRTSGGHCCLPLRPPLLHPHSFHIQPHPPPRTNVRSPWMNSRRSRYKRSAPNFKYWSINWIAAGLEKSCFLAHQINFTKCMLSVLTRQSRHSLTRHPLHCQRISYQSFSPAAEPTRCLVHCAWPVNVCVRVCP